MISPEEKSRRMSILKNALGNQHLEGLRPDVEVLRLSEKWANGEITIQAAIEQFEASVESMSK